MNPVSSSLWQEGGGGEAANSTGLDDAPLECWAEERQRVFTRLTKAAAAVQHAHPSMRTRPMSGAIKSKSSVALPPAAGVVTKCRRCGWLPLQTRAAAAAAAGTCPPLPLVQGCCWPLHASCTMPRALLLQVRGFSA